jgi:hypothetical protein
MTMPANGRDLIALQRSGRSPTWLTISLGWDYGKALPRLVIPADLRIGELDLTMISGIEVIVAHDGLYERRALDVAEIALANGAPRAVIFDMLEERATYTTNEIVAIRGRAAA